MAPQRSCRNKSIRLPLPWALLEKASMAEEHARANEIILDSAILLRAGVPIGLSSNPKIQAEARKEAVWNRDLRRYMRGGGIASGEQFGAPTITQHPPARRNA